MTEKALVDLALKARENSYNPYSKFRVGAAIETEDGTIFTGCNVESVSYTPTACAERTAGCKAVSEGHRRFKRIAVASDLDDFVYPCGVCRQFLVEFMRPDDIVIVAKSSGEYKIHTFGEVFPFSYTTFENN